MVVPTLSVAGPLHAWGSDPSWLAMDSSARGFHAQLLLVAVRQKPLGYLPDDDALWRRWLGLPAAWPASGEPGKSIAPDGVSKTLRRFFDEPSRKGDGVTAGMLDALRTVWAPDGEADAALARGSYERWIDHLWTTRWKPMVLSAWQRVDDALVNEHPHLVGRQGGFWSPLAVALAGLQAPTVGHAHTTVAPPPFVAPITPGRKGKKKASVSDDLPSVLSSPGVLAHGDVGPLGVRWLSTDSAVWRDLGKVARHWRAPVSSERRNQLWEVGKSCLATDLADRKQAGMFLGKLIRQYGEDTVAKAVAELSTRALPPADGYSFLLGILRRETEGSVAEQKARHQRSRVAL